MIHTAYREGGPGAWAVVVAGSRAVARASAAAGARLVHVSSDYGRAKAAAEQVVAAEDPGAVLVRTSLLLGGPAGEPSPHELAAADPGWTFWSDAVRCPVLVDDLAAALVELAGLAARGPLHAAGADAVTRVQLAELVSGRRVRAAAAPPGVPTDITLDCSLARAVLTTRLRGVRELHGSA